MGLRRACFSSSCVILDTAYVCNVTRQIRNLVLSCDSLLCCPQTRYLGRVGQAVKSVAGSQTCFEVITTADRWRCQNSALYASWACSSHTTPLLLHTSDPNSLTASFCPTNLCCVWCLCKLSPSHTMHISSTAICAAECLGFQFRNWQEDVTP